MNHPLRDKVEDFKAKWPTLADKLKACHDRGMSAKEAADDADVNAEAHKCGCIGILTVIGFIAIVNVLWEFWDHISNA